MNKISDASNNKRNILQRGLFMLCVVTVIQFVIVLVNGSSNERLIVLGRNLGSYLRQIAHFLTSATEDVPFPFSEWPAD